MSTAPLANAATTAADAATAAALLEREAAAVTELLDTVAAAAGPDTWRGPAADRFNAAVDGHRRALRSVADELRLMARRLLVGTPGPTAVDAGLVPWAGVYVPARVR